MKPATSPKRPQDHPPLPPLPPLPTEPPSRPVDLQARRSSSSGSSAASSTTSNQTALNVSKRTLYGLAQQQQQQQQHDQQLPQPVRPPAMAAGSVNGSNTSLALRPQNEPVQRRASPLAQGPSASSSSDTRGFRSRHHSQGFFEPSLPTASQSSSAAVSASRIAAQTAMQHQTDQHPQYHHIRNRSQTIPPPQESGLAARRGARDSPPPIQTNSFRPPLSVPSQLSYQSSPGGGRAAAGAATTAANVAFPRTPTPQSALPSTTGNTTTTITGGAADRAEPGGQKEKQKSEKSKMKLFSKPKHIGMSRDKEDKKEKTMPSPSKLASRLVNASTVSLNDPTGGGVAGAGAGAGGGGDININNSNNGLSANNLSLYSLANSSATTVVPIERHSLDEDRGKEKEKHRHHFLSRQKLKLKDKEDFHLPLSSASSNSRPLDPSAPQSLYSFAPSSPAASTFGKSMSGLDLRHGGRALREKKKEEKASAAAAAAAAAQAQAQQDAMMREGTDHQADWSGAASVTGSTVTFGGPSSSVGSTQGAGIMPGSNAAIQEILQGFGLQNMTPDDAWDFLKAKLLVLFEGEDVRIALEDLNKLVRVHIHCCVQKHAPHQVVEDLRDLLQTGFASLNYSLAKVPEENIIPHLVNVWVFAFGNVLPFIQATFLPLDLEFKGHGSIMNAREAREFWGAQPGASDASTSAGDALDVRKIVLTSFRDNVILTRYDVLKAAFSRLSLEKMNANINGPPTATLHSSTAASASRPSTAAGCETSVGGGSYASQPSSSHLNAGSFSSESAIASLTRARAISNTSSNPEHTYPSSYSSFSPSQPSILAQTHSHSTNIPAPPQPPPTDPSHVTETAGRMLQCICVLASVQSDDDAQQKIEELSKALKHNWLGRGRTGRNRRGFVGTKIRPPPPPRKNTSEEQADHQSTDETPRGTDATGW
ncbi:target of rapamycin complex 2 subunit [Trichophyton mentagrophytes]|nr:target of rapamycin complex 2 subunit [Trichophyton mentagrophytes]